MSNSGGASGRIWNSPRNRNDGTGHPPESSVTNVNGAAASANLALTIGSSGSNNTITGGTGNDAIALTGGTNDVQTGKGNDTVTTATNLAVGDRIDGGDGTDTLEIIHTGLATIPSTANLISIEQIAIQDTVHQSLDFSSLTTDNWCRIKLWDDCRRKLTITTTLAANQSLTLIVLSMAILRQLH